MTATYHEQGAYDAMLRFMNTPLGGPALVKVRDLLRTGHWPSWYVSTVGQEWRDCHPSDWAMEQVYAFMLFDDWLQTGAVAVVDIEVGDEPHVDRRRVENQIALDRIGDSWNAIVDQGQHCGDFDGTLTWDKPIAVSVRVEPGGDLDHGDGWMNGRVDNPGEARLEIGSTKASRSASHLVEGRALARWPYGHKSIRLFLDAEIFPVLTRNRQGDLVRYTPERSVEGRHRAVPSLEEVRQFAESLRDEPLPHTESNQS